MAKQGEQYTEEEPTMSFWMTLNMMNFSKLKFFRVSGFGKSGKIPFISFHYRFILNYREEE